MSIFGWHYPAGVTESDISPAHEDERKTCPACEGTGDNCSTCEGEGYVEECEGCGCDLAPWELVPLCEGCSDDT